ncbi:MULTISPECIES: hypothetical protein [Micrococcaceae]|uniref:Uncharacterized protein n=1 Tax=Pseudarthrobacter siccitolerans TaxID=861266 RepID=A0ABU0PNE5_9MICC|nr:MULTISPECIES: hypothetical protein [Micrococcaceae]MDQ0675466.1 hypothetical protein [Pseudarthrobacter siccitolerans]MDQ0692813.1 hypothetical protein [Arthrobacter sp. W4I7]
MDEKDQQALTGGVIQEHDLDLAQLWLDYAALGGSATQQDIKGYSAGLISLPSKERDILSQAVNERSDAAGRPRELLAMAPYSDSPLTNARKDPPGPC